MENIDIGGTGHDAGRGEELRVGHGHRRSGRVRGGPGRDRGQRRGDPRDPASPGRRRVRPYRRLRRRRGRVVRTTRTSTTSEPCPGSWGWRTRRSPTSATARTRTSAEGCIARPRRRGRWAGRECCRAKRCRSTTGWMRTRPSTWLRPCPRGSAVIVKHNNPCGVGVTRIAGRVLPRGVGLRPGQRVRRHRGVPRRGRCRGRCGYGRCLHRGGDRARVHRRQRARRLAERPNLRVVRAPSPDGHAASTSGRCPAGRWCRTATS